MKFPPDSLRGWMVPAALVVTATLLTAPWSYWVVKAAYDREVLDHAETLARRIEMRVEAAHIYSVNAPAQAEDVMGTELHLDPTVQTAVFFDIQYVRNPVGWTRPGAHKPAMFPAAEIRRRATSGILVEQSGDLYIVSVPWVSDKKSTGFTYLEFSRAALSNMFWKKQGHLVLRVIGMTATAIFLLSALTIYAYGARLKVANVQHSAELARQGMLAERGLTAAVLAHEIRNPLQALRFQLHSLRRNSSDTTRVITTVDTIDNELLRIQQLVTDYLEHEKARTMRVQSVDLADSAAGLQAVMVELFKQTRTELNVVSHAGGVLVKCDPHALRQVLMNLVLNAQQAMGEGGKVTLRIGKAGEFGTIDISDNGPGIPPEIREQLFKPFTTTKKEGHGIGLALVKRFVDNFEGTVTLDSEPERGTTFHLRLPLAVDAGKALEAGGGFDVVFNRKSEPEA